MAVKLYDYESILARLKASLLSKLDDSDDLLLFSTNAAILEAVAEELADSSLYDEFLTREAVWETALGTSSIMRQVGFYDYYPHRKIGSTGTLRISSSETFNGSWIRNISIPRFTQFSGGGLTFLSKTTSFLSNTVDYIDVEVIQGSLVNKTTNITESAFPELKYARIKIEDPDIENTLYEVKVNGVLWSSISHIRLLNSEDQSYVIKTLTDFSGVEISFGNGIFGKKLEYGDLVTFTYLKTEGENGNILSSGVVSSIDSTITDENGEEVTLYCTNTDALVGGDGYETVDEIRASAPRSFQTGNRAISSTDYQTLIANTGVVDKVQVWGEKEINEDNGNKPGTYIASSENLIYITGFTIDLQTLTGIPISESTQNIIRTALNEKKGTTDILQFVDTEIVYVNFLVEAFISDTKYAPDVVKANIHNILLDKYSILEGVYKKGLYLSDYYRTIDEAEGVDHHTTTLFFTRFLEFLSAYRCYIDLKIENLKPGSLELLLRNEAEGIVDFISVAKDDGAGVLVGQFIDPEDESKGKYDIVSDPIAYDTGFIGDILVTFGLDKNFSNYELKINFELQDTETGDLVLNYRQQLFAYLSDTVNTTLMGIV